MSPAGCCVVIWGIKSLIQQVCESHGYNSISISAQNHLWWKKMANSTGKRQRSKAWPDEQPVSHRARRVWVQANIVKILKDALCRIVADCISCRMCFPRDHADIQIHIHANKCTVLLNSLHSCTHQFSAHTYCSCMCRQLVAKKKWVLH